jgi:hypothetical protein
MANYNRLALLKSEETEMQNLRAHFPFRKWFAVKAENNQARFFDSQRKANNFARAHTPAAIYTC